MTVTLRKIVFMAMMLLSASVFTQQLPSGWRLPRASELTDEARASSPSRFSKAAGDFNGDAVTDIAFILKSNRFSGESLWVWLSQENGSHRWIKLESDKWTNGSPSEGLLMGVETQAPGVVSYVCFYTAPRADCDYDPPGGFPKLKLRHESFSYFKPEIGGYLYFWSNKYQRFLKVLNTIE